MLIFKSLYGLCSSGIRWHEKFADTLRDIGFVPSKNEPDIWMREANGLWEYISVYVDDLAFVVRDPESLARILKEKYGYKLKGTRKLSFHLSCDFF